MPRGARVNRAVPARLPRPEIKPAQGRLREAHLLRGTAHVRLFRRPRRQTAADLQQASKGPVHHARSKRHWIPWRLGDSASRAMSITSFLSISSRRPAPRQPGRSGNAGPGRPGSSGGPCRGTSRVRADNPRPRWRRPEPARCKEFPAAVCVNHQPRVCRGKPRHRQCEHHGIPRRPSATFCIGETFGGPARRRLSRSAVAIAHRRCTPGVRLGDVGARSKPPADGARLRRSWHRPPVHLEPHDAARGPGGPRTARLQAGMAITIEPMINLGGAEVRLLDDGWTVVTPRRFALGAV